MTTSPGLRVSGHGTATEDDQPGGSSDLAQLETKGIGNAKNGRSIQGESTWYSIMGTKSQLQP